MEIFRLPYLNAAIAGLCALILFSCIVSRKNSKKKPRLSGKAPPMAAGAWPIIGHLHLLAGTQLPHRTLGALADKFGPIYTIRLGMHRAVVVSSWEMAKECFTTHDAVLTSRPEFAAAKYLAYNYAMFAFTPHGAYWREIRKIVTLDLLSNRRIELLKPVRVSEVEMSMRDLYKLWDEKKDASGHVLVEMRQWFGNISLNIIVRVVAGKRYDGGDGSDESEKRRCQKALREFFTYLGMSVPSDAFPFLERFDIGGHIKEMKRIAQELDSILSQWLEQHRRKRVTSDATDQDEQDFMDLMISAVDGRDLGGYDNDTIIKATCLAIIAGASDTTKVTIVWAVSLLLNNPHALKKAQEELDTVIGRERFVEESDIPKLVYLKSIIKETMRLYPAAPLLAPREFLEDRIVDGYHMPKGTRLIGNAWRIQNDPRIWPDPSAFKPERFLTTHKDVDIKGQHFELLPFGVGRRGCPGAPFALPVVHLALANFLQAFDISTPSNTQVDMTESFGLTNLKATPLEVLVKPRIKIAI